MAVHEAGQHRAAARVHLHVGAGIGLEAGDPPVGEHHVGAVQRQLAGAVVAEVLQPVLGRAQHLRGAAQADGRDGHAPPIGMRTPRRSAASSASG